MTIPTLDQIQDAAAALRGHTLETPVLPLMSDRWRAVLPDAASVTLKLELFQQTGSFKARGAYLGMLGLTDSQRASGVVAASGGNHALAVAWAARAVGVSALIAMPRATDPVRVKGCEALGAEIVLCDDMAAAFALMEQEAAKGRALMHPFEADHMILGAATLGLEVARQMPEAQVFIIPVGGGGLIAGMAAGIKAVHPDARIIGVEPLGADSMHRSFAAGLPVTLDRVATIADSLGSPKALPMTYEAAREHVDRIVHVTDDDLRRGMRLYLQNAAILAEPACAASLAGCLGPLRDAVAGLHVGLIACGSNIAMDRFVELTR